MDPTNRSIDRRSALKAMGAAGVAAPLTGDTGIARSSAPLDCGDTSARMMTVNGERLTYPDLPTLNNRTTHGHHVRYDADAERYEMWIAWGWGSGFGQGARVYYYQSEDSRGEDWTEATATNIEEHGWHDKLNLGSVVRVGDRYVMAFDRYPHNTECSGWGGRTHIATSSDGVDWTDHGVVSGGDAFGSHRGRPKLVRPTEDTLWLYARTSGDGHCDSPWWRYEASVDDPTEWTDERALTLDGDRFYGRNKAPNTRIDDVAIDPTGSRVLVYGHKRADDTNALILASSPIDDGVAFRERGTLIAGLGDDGCGSLELGCELRTSGRSFPYYVGFEPEREKTYIMSFPNVPPVAQVEVLTGTPVAGQPVRFDAGQSTDPDGQIVGGEMRFGDGTVVHPRDPSIQHTYDTGGIYTVSLTVKDDQGVTDTVERDVTVARNVDVRVKTGGGGAAPINASQGSGVTPVALLGTEGFDPVSAVDVDSLRFGPSSVVDGGGGATARHGGERTDVNGDGSDDLLVHFATADAGFIDGDETAKVVGETHDGVPIAGTDTVRVVGTTDGRRSGNGGAGTGRGVSGNQGR